MAHKTLVNGTAYDTKGGKCLVGGTGYDVKKGRTLVGGTGYDVSFAPPVFTVKIKGSGYDSYSYVTIDGTDYTNKSYEQSTFELEEGTIVTCTVKTSNPRRYTAKVTLNGTVVARSSTTTSAAVTVTYEYVVKANATITLSYTSSGSTKRYGTISIVEE